MATARTTDTDAIRDTDLDKELADVLIAITAHHLPSYVQNRKTGQVHMHSRERMHMNFVNIRFCLH